MYLLKEVSKLGIRVFTLLFDKNISGFDDTEVRNFLADKRLLRVNEQFFEYGGVPHISLFLVYSSDGCESKLRGAFREKAESCEGLEVSGKESGNVSNRDSLRKKLEGLSKADAALYDSLREWRREKAQSEGIPVYLVASNSMLLDVVLNRPESLHKLQEINGFGEGKVKKFGSELIAFFMREKTGHEDE